MPSELERIIAQERRKLNADEAQARRSMRDVYASVIARIERELDATLLQIEAFPGAAWRRMHEMRLRLLLDVARAEYRRFSDVAAQTLEQTNAAAVSGGAATAAELLTATGVTVAFNATINRPALERLQASFAPGSPVRDVLDSYGTEGARIIERLLTEGLAAGESPRETKRKIMRQLNGGYTKARLDALTRTEFMRSASGSLFEQFAVAGLDEWRWSAAKSSRTCLACLAMDGRTFPMSEPFLKRHVACRCIPTPAIPGVAYESGPDWFARQRADVQRRMMPSTEAYVAYADGVVGLGDFVGVKHDRTWGDSVFQKSGRQALRGKRAA